MELLIGVIIIAALEIAACIWVVQQDKKTFGPEKQTAKRSAILESKLDAYFEENLKPVSK